MASKGSGKRNRDEHYVEHQPKAATQRQLVFAHIAAAGAMGATRHEIAKTIRRPLSSVCGRVRELLDKGEIVETKTKRQTDNGGSSVVLLASDFANSTTDEPKKAKPARVVSSSRTDDGYRLVSDATIPDVQTCLVTPKDDLGNLVRGGRIYHVRSRKHKTRRVWVGEDPNTGDPYTLELDAGSDLMKRNTRPVSISEMPAEVTWEFMAECESQPVFRSTTSESLNR